MVAALLDKGVAIESIAKVMESTPKQIERILAKLTNLNDR